MANCNESKEKKKSIQVEEEKILPTILLNSQNSHEINQTKIILFPDNKPKNTFNKKPVKNLIEENTLGYSFDPNISLGYIDSNVPLLMGIFDAHINHFPIRLKPDDIWLLIIQAFSNHVNANSEELRNYFVNFDGQKTLNVTYNKPFSSVDKKHLKIFQNK